MNAVAQKEQQQRNVTRMDEQRQFVVPAVNIYEAPDNYVLEADMPGVTKEGLEVTIEGNVLTIVGHKSSPEVSGGSLVFGEIQDADYRRTFELDPNLDTGKVSAKIDQGVLVVNLPKPEKVKPRKIEITTG